MRNKAYCKAVLLVKYWFKLFHFPSWQSQLKSVNLVGSVIEDWEEKGTPNVFSIQPREAKRKYVFSTNGSEEHKKWLQAVCLAKLSEQPNSEKSEACIIQ